MGKKSKSKKNNIAIVQQKKENKKESPKLPKKERRKISKQTLFGGALVAIMICLLVAVGFLLFNKAFRAQSIAKLLPEDSVIASLEINTNFEHSQVIKTLNLLKNYPEYSKDSLFNYVEKKIGLNYENDLKSWLGRSAGVAYLQSQKETGSVYELYFAEIISQESAKAFFSKNNAETYEDATVYSLKNKMYATSVDDYAFLSLDKNAIYEIIDAQENGKQMLYSADKFRHIDDNLPINRVAFIYLDFEKINNGFLKNFPFLSEKGLSLETAAPLFKMFRAEGFAVMALSKDFIVQSFLSLNTENLDNSQYVTFREKYNADLTDYVSKDALAFWGGQNLEYQLKRIIEVISAKNDDAVSFINMLIQNYVQKYFGSQVNFKEDLLPLFKQEFALAVESIEGKNIYKVLIKLADPESNQSTLQRISENFAQSGGVFDPQIVEHKLPDGTISKEIIAVPEQMQKVDSTYKDVIIHGLKVGNKDWGIYYAIINDVAVVATHIDGVKSSIDIEKDRKGSLKSEPVFDSQIKPILENSDEITYFNFKKLLPILLDKNPVGKYLLPLGSFSSGKNYFNDGIVTINYLHID